jgi:DNA-directed RNA polymerase specialized sigma24 family protein
MERSSIDVTLFLKRYSSGDQNALAELIPQIYDELRRLASCYLQRERVDHTLQTTALVHEAYFRLVAKGKANGPTATTSSGSPHK